MYVYLCGSLSLSVVWCGGFISLLFSVAFPILSLWCGGVVSLLFLPMTIMSARYSVVFADDDYVWSLSSQLRRHCSSVAGLLCSRPMAHGDTNELKAPAAL